MKIEYLADHPQHLSTVAAWQHAEFGYLNPVTTIEDRTGRLRLSLQKDALPIAFIAISASGALVGSAGILPATITHKHLTPWLSSVYVPDEFRGKGVASALSLQKLHGLGTIGCICSRRAAKRSMHGLVGAPSSGSNTTACRLRSWIGQ